MLPLPLRHALRSPLPDIAEGVRLWLRSGARIRRARMLCQCADVLRLQQAHGWPDRSLRLYRRSAKTLGELADALPAAPDPALAAHLALRHTTAPYRRCLAALARSAAAAALAAMSLMAVVATLSPAFRGRLFPRDLAVGRPWRASSGDLGLPATGAGQTVEENAFFHTRVEHNPFVEIDLGGEHVVRSIRVDNRPDCCQERALPLNVEIRDGGAWRLIAQRRTAFKVWRYDVGPVRTDKIRFLRPGNGYFHLKRISVYGQ